MGSTFRGVGDDFLADLQREVGLIEGEGNTDPPCDTRRF